MRNFSSQVAGERIAIGSKQTGGGICNRKGKRHVVLAVFRSILVDPCTTVSLRTAGDASTYYLGLGISISPSMTVCP